MENNDDRYSTTATAGCNQKPSLYKKHQKKTIKLQKSSKNAEKIYSIQISEFILSQIQIYQFKNMLLSKTRFLYQNGTSILVNKIYIPFLFDLFEQFLKKTNENKSILVPTVTYDYQIQQLVYVFKIKSLYPFQKINKSKIKFYHKKIVTNMLFLLPMIKIMLQKIGVIQVKNIQIIKLEKKLFNSINTVLRKDIILKGVQYQQVQKKQQVKIKNKKNLHVQSQILSPAIIFQKYQYKESQFVEELKQYYSSLQHKNTIGYEQFKFMIDQFRINQIEKIKQDNQNEQMLFIRPKEQQIKSFKLLSAVQNSFHILKYKIYDNLPTFNLPQNINQGNINAPSAFKWDQNTMLAFRQIYSNSFHDLIVYDDLKSIYLVLHYFRQILNCIAEIHSYGIVHGLINPINLVVNMNGQNLSLLKIKQFNIALFEKQKHEKVKKDYRGFYIPFDQIYSKEQQIWSAGLTIYYYLYNKQPTSFSRTLKADILPFWSQHFNLILNRQENHGIKLIETIITIAVMKMVQVNRNQRIKLDTAYEILQCCQSFIEQLKSI